MTIAERNVVAMAQRLAENADNMQEWSLFGGAATFTIQGHGSNGLEGHIQGNLGFPVSHRLLEPATYYKMSRYL